MWYVYYTQYGRPVTILTYRRGRHGRAVNRTEGRTEMIRLAVFLGNPGREYERTRHNLAWLTADALSFTPDLVWQKKFKGETAQHRTAAGIVYLLKPATFMNVSGESVLPAARFYKIAPEELLVVHDDIELPFGEAAFRKGGGLAGHNGLRSISKVLGTPEFYRFRLGVSRPARGSVSAHVLGRFSPEEEISLPPYLEAAAKFLERALTEDPAKTAASSGRMTLIQG
jgi:PTH1 family peptidyl-tRNA hydrolase